MTPGPAHSPIRIATLAQTNPNALVTARLDPNVDYVVLIAGYDYTETGPYTLAIR